MMNTKMAERENVERNLKHAFDGEDWNVDGSKILDFRFGAPGTDLLENCCDIFQKATEHRLRYEKKSNSSLIFQYGPGSGTLEVRSAIAKYFSKVYGGAVKSEDLIITAGSSQGLHFIISTLVDFNGYIFVDEVTFMVALDTFKQYSTMKIVPVRLNDDGVDLEHLESVLKEKKFEAKNKVFWGMYYAIPVYHNPTGILFSEKVCSELIKLARKYDILITCDDVYNALYYEGTSSPKRLFAYDNHADSDFRGNVISNASFSKIIGPGMRLGWLEVPARVKSILEDSGVCKSGGCFNNYTAGIMASLFELNLAQEHINCLHATYKERMLAAREVFKRELPSNCSMNSPSGGCFLWIRLPEQVDAREFREFCFNQENIYFFTGPEFAIEKNTAANCLRIPTACHTKEELIDGALRLCSSLKKFLKV